MCLHVKDQHSGFYHETLHAAAWSEPAVGTLMHR
jgi:hypothetical protein